MTDPAAPPAAGLPAAAADAGAAPANPLRFCFQVREGGEVRRLDWDEVRAAGPDLLAPEPGLRCWLHLDREAPGAGELLEALALDPGVASNLVRPDARPRARVQAGGVLVNLRGVNLNPGKDVEDMVSVRLWARGALLVSTSADRVMSIAEMRESYEAGTPPDTYGRLIAVLALRLCERIEPVVHDLEDQMDALEDRMLQGQPPKRTEFARFRRVALGIRRYIIPQREALASMVRLDGDLFVAAERNMLREAQDIIIRLAEDIDALRERAMVVTDELAEARANIMNQRLFVLSIISAVFLPLGFITGLFGVNVGGLPGTEAAGAFLLLCAGMTAIGLAILAAFRFLDWL